MSVTLNSIVLVVASFQLMSHQFMITRDHRIGWYLFEIISLLQNHPLFKEEVTAEA